MKAALWIFPLLLLFAIGTVWLRLSAVRTTYAISKADHQLHELQIEREKTGLRSAALRSPLKLEVLARGKFHLSQPHSDQVIRLEPAPVPAEEDVSDSVTTTHAHESDRQVSQDP